MKRVFLSYPQRDRELAADFQRVLEAHGILAYNPVSERASGQARRTAIREALQASDAVLVLIASPYAAANSWVGYEVGLADAIGKTVFVLLSDTNGCEAIPVDIGGHDILTFDQDDLEATVAELLELASLQAA